MKNEIAVMDFGVNNRVAKYLDFDTAQEADDHIVKFKVRYPNAFRATAPSSDRGAWRVNGDTLIDDPEPPTPPPTPAERIAAITEGDDFKRVVFKLLFKLVNDKRGREVPVKPPLTVDQYLTFLEGELE